MPFKIMKRKQRIFRIFFISYLGILSLPIFVGSILYREVINVVRDDSFNTQLDFLETRRDILDKQIKELECMAIQWGLNSKINNFLYLDSPLEGSNIYKVWETWQELAKTNVPDYLVIQSYIFFNRSNVLISPEISYVRLPFFDQTFFTYRGMTFVEWKEKSLERYFDKEYFPAAPTTFQEKNFSAITYLRSLPISQKDHSSACLIIFIDISKINEIFESIDFGQSGSFFITNAKGQLLTGFSSKPGFSLPPGISFSKSRGFFEKEIHGEYMSIIHTTLPHNHWQLVAVIPSEIIMAKVNYIKNLFLIITVFIIMLGAIAALLFAYLNSKPIKNLITNLKERMIEGKAQPSNEYDFLKETFASLVDSNKELNDALKKQAPLIRGVFIDSLLKGKFSTHEEIDSFSHNDFRMEGNKFLVLLVHIIGYHGLFHKQSFDAINLSRSIVIGVLEREPGRRLLIREVDIDKIVLLLSFDTANQDWQNVTETFSEKLKSHCLDNYNIRLSFSAGSMVENALDIHISYMEAEEALDYKGLQIQK